MYYHKVYSKFLWNYCLHCKDLTVYGAVDKTSTASLLYRYRRLSVVYNLNHVSHTFNRRGKINGNVQCKRGLKSLYKFSQLSFFGCMCVCVCMGLNSGKRARANTYVTSTRSPLFCLSPLCRDTRTLGVNRQGS